MYVCQWHASVTKVHLTEQEKYEESCHLKEKSANEGDLLCVHVARWYQLARMKRCLAVTTVSNGCITIVWVLVSKTSKKVMLPSLQWRQELVRNSDTQKYGWTATAGYKQVQGLTFYEGSTKDQHHERSLQLSYSMPCQILMTEAVSGVSYHCGRLNTVFPAGI